MDPGPSGEGFFANTALRNPASRDPATGARYAWEEVLSLHDVSIGPTSAVVFGVFWRPPGGVGKASERLAGWAWTNVLGPKGQVREDFLEAPLFRPPVRLRSGRKARVGGAMLEFQFGLRFASEPCDFGEPGIGIARERGRAGGSSDRRSIPA